MSGRNDYRLQRNKIFGQLGREHQAMLLGTQCAPLLRNPYANWSKFTASYRDFERPEDRAGHKENLWPSSVNSL